MLGFLSFQSYLAGKALTSFNLLIFLGTFIMQWFMGLVIDLVKNFGYTEIIAFKTAFSFFLLLSLISYIFFCILSYLYQAILITYHNTFEHVKHY